MSAYGQGDVSRTAQYFRLLKMARIVKTLRIIRIFKLARHSTGLQALGNTMKANYKELGLLFLLLGMGAIMFASLIFVFEKEDTETTFKTMFDAYWWAIITMTTVGQNLISIPTAISAKHWKLSFRSVFFFSEIQHFTLYSLHLRSQVVTRREAEWPRKEVTLYFPSQLFLPHIYFL